jgi:mRNA interferase MazF
MPLDFGTVVLVPFPFTDETFSKRRPAVVASLPSHNARYPDIIMMAITSQLRPTPMLGEVWLAGWQAAGLLKPSVIKPVFATIEQRVILVLRDISPLN